MVAASLSRRSHVIGGVVIFTDLLHSAAWSKWTQKNQSNQKKRLWEKASPTSHWGSVNSERRRQVPHGTKTTEPPLAKIITGGHIKIRRVREVKLQVEKRTCSQQHLDQSKKQPVHHDTKKKREYITVFLWRSPQCAQYSGSSWLVYWLIYCCLNSQWV